MLPLFLGISVVNLLGLVVVGALGYGVRGGRDWGTYHQLGGVLATLTCCAVHCIVFTYFIATAKWMRHAIDVKRLDPALADPTRSFKAQAFPAALLAIGVVFLTAVFGAARVGYGVSPLWHHVLAVAAVVVNAGVAALEYRAIVRNGALIESILDRLQVRPAT